MKNPDHGELWRDALDEGVEDALAAASLAGMLAYARHRRRRRRLLGVSAVAAALGVLFCLTTRLQNPSRGPLAAHQSPGVPTAAPEATGLAQVHFLTDEELLSRFPDRPIALIGPPGDRRLVFLDQTP